MYGTGDADLFPQRLHQRQRQDGDTVLAAFACPNQNLPAPQTHIQDSLLRTLEQAHASAVQQAGNQLIHTAYLIEYQFDFGLAPVICRSLFR